MLAAYFILDDDGVRGLSRDQLVGVLTTEAGVGIDTEQVGCASWPEGKILISRPDSKRLETFERKADFFGTVLSFE